MIWNIIYRMSEIKCDDVDNDNYDCKLEEEQEAKEKVLKCA